MKGLPVIPAFLLLLLFYSGHAQSERDVHTADSLHHAARQLVREGENTAAVKLFRLVLVTREKQPSEALASTCTQLGIAYRNLGQYDSALFFMNEGLRVRQQVHSPDNIKMANSYRPLANYYRHVNDHSKAVIYMHETIRLASIHFGPDHDNIADAYNYLGLILGEMGRDKEAMEAFRKAYQIRRNLPDVDAKISSILNFGWIYEHMEKYDSALLAYDEALRMIRLNTTGPNRHEALIYNNMGVIYTSENMKNLDSSRFYLKRAIAGYREIYPDNNSNIIRTMYNLAVQERMEGNHEQAIAQFTEVLRANSRSGVKDILVTPVDINDFYIIEYAISAHRELAMTYQAMDYAEVWRKGLEHIDICTKMIEQWRGKPREYNDQVRIAEMANWIYEIGLELCFLLKDDDEKMVDKGFYYSEMSRASLLKLFLADLSVRRLGYVPDSLLLMEQTLSEKRDGLREKLETEMDSVLRGAIRSNLIETEKSYETLIRNMENDLPEYYQAKYAQHTSSTADVRSLAVRNKTAVVEYFLAESSIYTFVFAGNRIHFNRIPFEGDFSQRITNFFQAVQGNSELPAEMIDSFIVQRSFELYDTLIRPLEKYFNDYERLTIVPHSQLALVPFDMLLTAPVNGKVKSRSNPYLIRKYALSQAFSASMLEETKTGKRWSDRFIGYAPQYDEELLATAEQLSPYGAYRNSLAKLKFTKNEVTRAASKFKGEIRTGSGASEYAFKEQVHRYQIIHLAMHAIVDAERPLNSKLIFAKDSAGVDDGYLNIYELYNIEMNAELAVLSACSTGYGRWEAGEGILSIGRAFAYAGCPSVVMSLWPAQDQATSELMDYFYTHLANGKPKDVALQLAKLDYLDNANDLFTHPFYWSGFVLQGNASAVNDSDMSVIYFSLITAFIMLLVIYFIRQKKRKSS